MFEIRRVLFPTDFSDCSRRALVHAVRIARKYGAELHLLHADVLHEYVPHDPGEELPHLSEIEDILQRLALKRMGTLVGEEEGAGMVIRQVHLRGVSAAPLIVDYAREGEVDLIVMGTHGRRGVRRLLMGSVAGEVQKMAPCSVLTVRGPGEEASPPEIRRILVPIDFSQHGKEALVAACRLADGYGAELQLLHVLSEVMNPPFYEISGFGIPLPPPRLKEKTLSELRSFLEGSCGAPHAPVTFHVLKGDPPTIISRFAKGQESDLIVMATHGLTGIMHFLLGSTTERVLAGAECPVLVVRG